jgi:hypothetical protein
LRPNFRQKQRQTSGGHSALRAQKQTHIEQKAIINLVSARQRCAPDRFDMENAMDTPEIKTIFDGTDWELAPLEISHIEKLYPNQLAYHESSSTLALIVTRSFSGEDFALSEAGQLFIEAALEKGQRKDGKAVKAAWVVC